MNLHMSGDLMLHKCDEKFIRIKYGEVNTNLAICNLLYVVSYYTQGGGDCILSAVSIEYTS